MREFIYRASVDTDALGLCLSRRKHGAHMGIGFREDRPDAGVFFLEWPVRLQVGFAAKRLTVRDWRRSDNPETLALLQWKVENRLAEAFEWLLQPAIAEAAHRTAAVAGREGCFCRPLWIGGLRAEERPFPKSPLSAFHGGPSWEPLFDEAVFFGYDYAEPPERLSFLRPDLFNEVFLEHAQKALKLLQLWYGLEQKIFERFEVKPEVQPGDWLAGLMAQRKPPRLLQPGEAGRPPLEASDLITTLECALALKEENPRLSLRKLCELASRALLKRGISLSPRGVRHHLARAFEEAGLSGAQSYNPEALRRALERLKAKR